MGVQTFRAAIAPRPGAELIELARDLDATWPLHEASAALDAWIGRPAILRRVAEHLARRLPRPCDRIIAFGPHAAPLAAAVGLASGVPWQLADAASAATDGSVALVAIDAADLPGSADAGPTDAEPATTSTTTTARLAVIGADDDVALFRSTPTGLEVPA